MYKGKVELHLHMDGALSVPFTLKYLQKYRLPVPPDLEGALSAPSTCQNLVEYLKCFDIPGLILQYADSLENCAYDLVSRLAAEGIIYAEIRFAPAYHCRNGLTQTDVVEAVLRGIRRAESDCPSIQIGLLLCFIVGDDHNYETLKTGLHFAGQGVAGMDLAGPEGSVPMEAYRDLFERVKAADIPFTIHAGECGDYQNVLTAISLGAKRIGHGVAAIQSPECMDLLREQGSTVECCVTSNLQTRAVQKITEHPFYPFYQAGIAVTVNTDNTTVSQTCLSKEHKLLATCFPLSDEDFIAIDRNAIEGAFLSREDKAKLSNLL